MDRPDEQQQLLFPLDEAPTYAPRRGHLLMSRKPGEWVQIGNIRIRIVKGGREPILSIQAPEDTPIVRGEHIEQLGLAESYKRELARRQHQKHRQRPKGRLTQLQRAA